MRFYDYWSAAEFTGELSQLREKFDGLFARLNQLKEELAARGDRLAVSQLYYLARLAELGNTIDVLKRRRPNVVVFHEPFLNLANFDLDAVGGTPADVIFSRGLLVLKRTEEKVAEVAEVVVTSGNGLPGNTHQVYPDSGIYCGAEDAHLDLGAIVDGNVNTWFEYERLSALTGAQYFSTRYLEGCPWLTERREPLELALKVRLDRRQIINWVTAEPFLPAERGYIPPYLDLLFDDGRGRKQEVNYGQLTQATFIPTAPQQVRTVTLFLRQPVPYSVTIGVPESKLQLRELGLDYDAANRVIKQPVWRSDETPQDWSELRQRLAEAATHTAPALRYQVGLRGIQMGAYRYNAAASYVSYPYVVSGEIAAVRLDVNVSSGALLAGQSSVRAFLSVDDGASWLPVRIPGSGGNEPVAYAFGQYVPEAVRQPNTAYLGSLRPTAVRVRLDLARPDTGQDYEPYVSPVVSEYTLEVSLLP